PERLEPLARMREQLVGDVLELQRRGARAILDEPRNRVRQDRAHVAHLALARRDLLVGQAKAFAHDGHDVHAAAFALSTSAMPGLVISISMSTRMSRRSLTEASPRTYEASIAALNSGAGRISSSLSGNTSETLSTTTPNPRS